ncbi:MAG: class I SAM-dependent methyltransferase [Clostridia bacterium]|nr:class I SAM-dependent methyltransferase [Clostridia bacterium]
MEQNALALSHAYIERCVTAGDVVVDATAGNGNDTLFLAELVGKNGKVFAFDIQEAAILNTKKRLCDAGVLSWCDVICDGHEHMEKYVKQPVKAAMFNFGRLPGGDVHLFTKPETSVRAVQSALNLLVKDGVVTLAVYYGGPNGYDERDALLLFLRNLDHKTYSVLYQEFINYPNEAPLLVCITKTR